MTTTTCALCGATDQASVWGTTTTCVKEVLGVRGGGQKRQVKKARTAHPPTTYTYTHTCNNTQRRPKPRSFINHLRGPRGVELPDAAAVRLGHARVHEAHALGLFILLLLVLSLFVAYVSQEGEVGDRFWGGGDGDGHGVR